MASDVRIDKWLWAVRFFKTRSEATNACKKGRVIIDDIQVKPSRIIKENENVVVKKNPVTYTLQVIKKIEKRVGAKIAITCYKDLTPEKETDKLKHKKNNSFFYEGKGRPTKKERRMIDKIKKSGSI